MQDATGREGEAAEYNSLSTPAAAKAYFLRVLKPPRRLGLEDPEKIGFGCCRSRRRVRFGAGEDEEKRGRSPKRTRFGEKEKTEKDN
jgi:hypothetical protein